MEVFLDGHPYSFDRKEIRQFTLANLNSYGSLEFSWEITVFFLACHISTVYLGRTENPSRPIRIGGFLWG